MTDDLVKRARYALHDMEGRVDGSKLAMFAKCIDRIEALTSERDALLDAIDYYEIGVTAVGVHHPKERQILKDCVLKAREIVNKVKGVTNEEL